MTKFKQLLAGAILIQLLNAAASAAEWQSSVAVKSEKPENGPARAWLWIPPNCEKVHGIVVAQHNMEEISILENPKFRAALAEMNFAEVWVAPFFDHLFRFNQGAGETFDGMMDNLANESGYSELKFVPVVPMGHSAAANWPYYFAAWNPERTLAALSVSGQWPYFRDQNFAPDIWGDRNLDFVPCLESMGEYESADTWSREGLWERQQHSQMPLSMLANPGQCHFAATDAKVEYLALYLKKAAQYRLPKNWDASSAPKLIPIDPTKTGWLVDKWRKNQTPTAQAAPVVEYRGDPKQAFWFFDKGLAQATEKYEAAGRGLKPQLVGYVQDGKMSPQTDTHLQVTLKFEPEADGVTFKLSGAFYDTVPAGSPRLPGWTGLPTNSPLGHDRSHGRHHDQQGFPDRGYHQWRVDARRPEHQRREHFLRQLHLERDPPHSQKRDPARRNRRRSGFHRQPSEKWHRYNCRHHRWRRHPCRHGQACGREYLRGRHDYQGGIGCD